MAMEAIDTAPDSWDQEDDGEAQVDVQLSNALSTTLNVDAKPFVPNVHAAEFIPTFLPKGSTETVESAGEFPVFSRLLTALAVSLTHACSHELSMDAT